MQIESDKLQLLMEIGLLAAGQGMGKEAETIFRALEAARPDSELPLIGRAIMHMNLSKNDMAILNLRSALLKNPNSELAMAFLGFALKSMGMNEASENALRQVTELQEDNAATALASAMLSEHSTS
ncbi:MAG: hypothetical protein AAF483_09955 [Planctomycetota bacterium]